MHESFVGKMYIKVLRCEAKTIDKTTRATKSSSIKMRQ
jgi:hypothetical protein